MTRKTLWSTPERDELLRREYPNNRMTARQLLAAINELPGAPCRNTDAMTTRTKALGLRRTPRGRHAVQPKPPDDPALTAAERSYSRIPVDLLGLKRGAKPWGIEVVDWDDLRIVNDKADRIGHPGFKKILPSMKKRCLTGGGPRF